MSLPPEYVPQIQEMLAHLRSATRIGEAMLREIAEPSGEVCAACGGKGVIHDYGQQYGGPVRSYPCECPKGAPFRAAAAMQRAKAVGRERATGERE